MRFGKELSIGLVGVLVGICVGWLLFPIHEPPTRGEFLAEYYARKDRTEVTFTGFLEPIVPTRKMITCIDYGKGMPSNLCPQVH